MAILQGNRKRKLDWEELLKLMPIERAMGSKLGNQGPHIEGICLEVS